MEAKTKRLIALVVILSLAYMLLPLEYSRLESMGTSEHYIENWEEIGTGNLVMGVLADWRLYDSVIEAMIFFTGILGSYLILEEKHNDE